MPSTHLAPQKGFSAIKNPLGSTTTHQILVSNDLINWSVVEHFTIFTTDFITFERTFNSPISNIRGVRVLTTQSPSWIAWFEIEVWGR